MTKLFLYLLLSTTLFFQTLASEKHTIVDSLNQIADIKLYNNPEESRYYSAKAIALCYSNKNSTTDEKMHSWISNAYALSLLQKPIEAIDTLENAVIFINKTQNDQLVGRMLNLFSSIHKELRNDTVSLNSYYNQVWKNNDTLSINRTAKGLCEMGIYYNSSGKLDKALFYFQKYLKWVDQNKDSLQMAQAYNHIGTVYQNLFQVDLAISNYQKSFDYMNKTNNQEGITKAISNIGAIFLIQRQYDSAIVYIEKAALLFEKQNDTIGHVKALSNLGIAYEGIEDYKKAENSYFESLNLAKKINSTHDIALNLLNLGTYYYLQFDIKNAEYYYLKAKDAAEHSNNMRLKMRISYALSMIFEKNNMNKKALTHLRDYIYLQDSAFNQSTSEKIAELTTRYELERKNQEIINLNKDREIQTLKLNQRKSQTRLLLIILIGAIIVISLIAYFLAQRNKVNKILADQNDSIGEKNEELNQINDELKSINHQLIDSHDKLNKANQTKEKLLSIIAHDIKSPLTATKSFIMIIRKQMDDLSKEELLDKTLLLENSIFTVNELLNNLLNWGKTQKKSFKPVLSNFNVNDLIKTNIALFNGWSNQKKVVIIFNSKEIVTIDSDKNMLDFIIRNLFSNAIKFSPENSQIIVIANLTDKLLKISISDQGIGMDESTLSNLFNTINRPFNTGTQNEKGTGLGLVICQEFAQKLGGTLSANSTINSGSTFTLSLIIT